MWIKNTWYVAAKSAEVQDQPLGRTVCGEVMVFFRGPEGTVSALQDYCPHRGAPLSLGRVVDGVLVCGYHGLKMGCDGKTIALPGQTIPGGPVIKPYPAVERYGFVWVWPGDAALADPASIPVFDFFENPNWAYGGGYYAIACDYRLMVDNLMDLTHESFVHSTSIGQKEIDETPCITTVDGHHVTTSRFIDHIMAPPFWQMALAGNGLANDVPVDRWQICHFTPPSHVMIEVGVAHAGQGGYHAPQAVKVSSVVVDFITPETATTMHYFWGMARQFQPQNAELTTNIREGQAKIFAEDLAMLEGQQRNLLAFPTRKLLSLNIDSGGLQSRRIIEQLIASEVP